MPIDLSDFPAYVQEAVEIYNRLSDRFTSTELGPLYIGKDITSIELLFSLYNITDIEDKKLTLEIVQHIDQKTVKQAVAKIKAEAKRLSNKNKANQGRR